MNIQPPFIPLTKRESRRLGIGSFDIIVVSGDAYVDHPSFAAALIARMLWGEGYTVGIIAQPDWTRPDDFIRLGKPRLFFAISAGNVDSMVNHYTARKRLRSTDAYSPGGKRKRPDRASLVYADRLHSLFPDTRLSSGASRRVSGGLPTMTTGQTGSASPCSPMHLPICSSSGWVSGRSLP